MCRDKFCKRRATCVLRMTKYLTKNQINGATRCVYGLEGSFPVVMPIIPELILSLKQSHSESKSAFHTIWPSGLNIYTKVPTN